MTRPRPDASWWLILLGAAASFLAFGNPVARLPFLVLAAPLAWALLAATAPDARRALKRGWLCGWLGASASLYWIAIPVHDYGFLPWVLAVPCPLLMGAVLGGYPALFCWAAHVAGRRLSPLALGGFAALAWTALEAAKGYLFSGFPWLPLAAALTPWPLAIQGVSVIGAYGLSGLLAGCGVWLAGPGALPRAVAALTLLLLAGHGAWALSRPVVTTGQFNAAMIQGNIDQAAKWDPQSLEQAVGSYIGLSRQVLASRPEVVIWPETALTFFVQEPSALSSMVRRFAAESGAAVLAGAPGYERRGRDADIFNRAYLVTGEGLGDFYDKEHLVPFGEYAPFGKGVPILSDLMQGVGAFTPGVKTAPLRHGRLAMGMLICYESIFPELAQARVAAGANVLVNISNDAWFGRSAAPRQHLELAVLRAVEQNRFLLRATNTGITALVDPRGRVSGETALFTEAAASVSGVGLVSETTVYHGLHGHLEFFSGFAALAVMALAAFTNKRARD